MDRSLEGALNAFESSLIGGWPLQVDEPHTPMS
jgi:hypothetical protein